MEFDLVISGGTLVDGTGRPRYPADIGIQKGKIAALSQPGQLKGGRTFDASGHAVAPGCANAGQLRASRLPTARFGLYCFLVTNVRSLAFRLHWP